MAVMLQHHNYQTTLLLTDKDVDKSIESTMQIPSDHRIAVDVAMQSNELYLHSAKKQKHPDSLGLKMTLWSF